MIRSPQLNETNSGDVLNEVVLTDLGLDGGDGDIPARLHRIYQDMKSFCKDKGIPLYMNNLTRNLLNFNASTDYPTGPLAVNIDFGYVYIYIYVYCLRGCKNDWCSKNVSTFSWNIL